MLEFLEQFFKDGALDFAGLTSAVEAYNANQENKEKQILPIDLSAGGYVSKNKLDDKIKELGSANEQITNLTNTVKEFEGVDLDELRGQLTSSQEKYTADTTALKTTMKKNEAIHKWLDSHPSKHRSLLKTQFDLEKIQISDDGKISGLDEQGEVVAESYKDLFISEQEQAGGMHQSNNPSSKDPAQMSMDEYKAWREKL